MIHRSVIHTFDDGTAGDDTEEVEVAVEDATDPTESVESSMKNNAGVDDGLKQ